MSPAESPPPRQQVYDVIDNSALALDTKQQRLLEIGRQYLGVENGHIERINHETDTHEIIASVGGGEGMLPEGAMLDQATTYCRRTIKQRSPLALSHASQEGWEDDPAYQQHALECYLGATIFVDGDQYGTVCFVSREPRSTEFDAQEKAFIELLARMLGHEIETTNRQQNLADRKRERDQLRQKYDTLLDAVPDGIFIADVDTGEFVDVNEAATELTGYPREELLGLTPFDLHLPEDRAEYHAAFEQFLEDSGTIDRLVDGTPLTLQHRDGEEIPVELSAGRTHIDGDAYLIGVVRDISERREYEHHLKENRDFLRRTEELANTGGWIVDTERETRQWTQGTRDIFEVDHEKDLDFTAQDINEFYHPKDRSTAVEAIRQCIEHGEPIDEEFRIITAEDNCRWIRLKGQPIREDGDIVRIHGAVQDITDRKQREHDLELKNRAIETASVGITIADATADDLPLTYVNEEFERITGYSPSEALGRNCRFLQGPATDETDVEVIRKAIAQQEPVTTELLNYRSDGTPFWNELTLTPVTDPDGETTHFVGFQRDITTRKRRTQLLEILNRVLRHNVRNDMTAIVGFAEMLADQYEGEVASKASRIASVGRDLTAVSEKAQTIQQTVRNPTESYEQDIVAMVDQTATTLEEEYPDARLSVETPAELNLAIPDRFEEVFYELGENAIKHGGETPTVTYKISEECCRDECIEVAVEDDGPGLPAHEQNVVEWGEETVLEHGSGIGLWLVNWMTTRIGGEVSTEVDESGTVVRLRLPRTSGEGDINQTAAICETGRWSAGESEA